MSDRRLAWIAGLLLGVPAATLLAAEPSVAGSKWPFIADGPAFRFDTGLVKGRLRGGDRAPSQGITALAFGPQELPVTTFYGLFSHYRLLDANARYSTAAWDWPSEAKLLPDGRVEVSWHADADHPFDLTAVYAWAGDDTLDVVSTVTPHRELYGFELYLASYHQGFPTSYVYAREGDAAALVAATQSAGEWQIFPRDAQAVQLIGDGRWKRLPHPVEWTIRSPLAAPLGLRRDPPTGLAVLVMAPPEDCFAVSTPYGEEGHRSVYLSLFGRNLPAGQAASVRARLVVAHNISDQEAIEIYRRAERDWRAAADRTPR